MLRLAGLVGVALAILPAAVAPQGVDADVLERGEQLYEQQCAVCHQDSGAGDPPTFPALTESDQLADPVRIVRTIHLGRRRMPPFPALTTEELSAVVTYVRNTLAGGLGAVATEEVTGALEGVELTGTMASVWDGVFTEEQASRGQSVYAGHCGTCHGRGLNGAPDDPDRRSSPPLARARFLRIWEGRSLATLYEYVRATMPEDNPDSLSEQEYVDIIAHMLNVGGMPSGADELPPDPASLARIIIGQQP